MAEQKKEWFREHVKERVAKDLHQGIDSLDNVRRSYWMTKVYVDEIATVLFPGMLPEDSQDLANCHVDASKDAGADFISRNEGNVLIIQSKYHGSGVSESPEFFDSFADAISRLHPRTGRSVPKNQALKNILDDIDWDNDRFEMQFLTLGKVNEAMRAREVASQRPIEGILGIEDRVDLSLIDEQGLNDRLRDALSAAAGGLRVPVDILFKRASDSSYPPWITHETTEGKRAWVGLASARQLSNLKKHRSRLFNLNIRNYIGDNTKNNQIRQTAIDDPENFFFFNNGISAVATKVIELPNAEGIRCEEFSIINGAQTFRSLIKAQEKAPGKAGDACVLLRVTEVSLRKKTEDMAFIDKVTQFNNTQNAILISDFRSNDGVQRALNKRFAQLARKGGKVYSYRNKRTGERPRHAIVIGMEEFAQTIYAFRNGPVDAKGGKPYLFDASSKGGYCKIFGSDGKVWDSVTEEDFEHLAGEWFACSQAREILAEIRDDAIAKAPPDMKQIIKAALERRWMAYYTLGEILREKYRREDVDLDRALRKLSNPKWLDEDPTKGDLALLRKYCGATKELLVRCYRNAMRLPSFVHRNWNRSEDTLSDIRDEINLGDSLLDNLPLFRDVGPGPGLKR